MTMREPSAIAAKPTPWAPARWAPPEPTRAGLRFDAVSELDFTDHEILELLRIDARRTLADIAARVSLSAAAVKRRIERLERDGVILGYTTQVDHAQLGRPLEAFTELRFAGDSGVDEIAAIGDDIPEVQEVFTTAGDPDALVRLRVRDVDDLKRVVHLLRRSGRVTATKTLMVLGASRRRP
jgi:Lrp/AsnC family transcriptional regulator, leucine-responsive regulatory protein